MRRNVYARIIVGGQATGTLRTDLALDALKPAIEARKDEDLWGFVHHSNGAAYTGRCVTPNASPHTVL